MRYLSLYILIVLQLITSDSFSQSPIMVKYNIENGLAGNRVYSIYQDRKGFIWICTDNGLSKFDGIRFKNFNTNNGLPDNDVFNLVEDAKGRIWFACYNKAPVYIYNDKIYTRENDSFLRKIDNQEYLRFSENKYLNEIYITGAQNFYKINSNGEIINENLFFKNPISNVIGFKKQNIYFNQKKIYLVNNHQCIDSFHIQTDESNNYSIINTSIKTSENSFAFIYNNYFIKYKIINNKISHEIITKKNLTHNYIINNGNQILMSTLDNGIQTLDSNLEIDNRFPSLLANKISPNIFIDDEGNKWFGTQNEGVYIILNNGISKYNIENGLYKDEILNSYQYNNKIMLNYGFEKNQYIINKKIYDIPFQFPDEKLSKTNHILENENAIVYAGDYGVILQSKSNGKITKIAIGAIKCLTISKKNTLLVGNSNSAKEINIISGEIIRTILNRRTTSICEDNKDNIWLGGINGVLKYNRISNRIDTNSKLDPIKKYRITDIKNYENIIFIATVQNGIYIFNNNELININTSKGLSDNNCNKIHISKNHTIWIATNSGINKIQFKPTDYNKYTIQIINRFTGIQTNYINSILEINDTLYVTTAIGVLVIPTSYPIYIDSPKVYISEMNVNDQFYPISNSIKLNNSENNIDFYLSGISYQSLGNILFKYRIINYVNEWQETKNNLISLKKIPPGNYKLEVYAKNSQGIWSVKPAIINFKILPAWWQSIWFYIICIVILFIISYFLIRWQIKNDLKKKEKRLEISNQLVQLELIAIKAQINPHFIFNSLNSIQYFINNNYIEMADSQLNRLSNLIRKTLDYSGQVSIKLTEEIDYLKNYIELEKVRFKDQFEYQIINEIDSINELYIPPMVIQPHIENAIKHGLKPLKTKKILKITFKLEQYYLICEIMDNGIGVNQSLYNKTQTEIIHQSKGNDLSNSRLNLHYKITGKKIKTKIIDLTNTEFKQGTLVRIVIEI